MQTPKTCFLSETLDFSRNKYFVSRVEILNARSRYRQQTAAADRLAKYFSACLLRSIVAPAMNDAFAVLHNGERSIAEYDRNARACARA